MTSSGLANPKSIQLSKKSKMVLQVRLERSVKAFQKPSLKSFCPSLRFLNQEGMDRTGSALRKCLVVFLLAYRIRMSEYSKLPFRILFSPRFDLGAQLLE